MGASTHPTDYGLLFFERCNLGIHRKTYQLSQSAWIALREHR